MLTIVPMYSLMFYFFQKLTSVKRAFKNLKCITVSYSAFNSCCYFTHSYYKPHFPSAVSCDQ